MRNRGKIVGSLETMFQEAFESAQKDMNEERMEELDFAFQRDQIMLEVLLDIRDSLGGLTDSVSDSVADETETSLLDKAKAIRKFTKLRLP